MGHSDMVLNHIRLTLYQDHSRHPPYACHAATRDFYARVLGTPDYGFVTVLRHPVDR